MDSLDNELKQKIQPIINQAMQKFLGVTISEMVDDLSTKLQQPLFGIIINFDLDYKASKKDFKKKYIERLLILNYGNISEVAKIIDVDRRTIHRIIEELGIDIERIRKELLKPSYLKEESMRSAITETITQFKDIIHPVKLEKMYQNVPELTKNILQDIPQKDLSLKEAEIEFEKIYLKKKLEEFNGNVVKCAKAIGLRYETLLRKKKELGL